MRFIHVLTSPFSDVKFKTSTYGINIPVLDGIRGLAVLIVLASHTNAFYMKGQGSLGVLLFFFLSGFVLIIPFYENPNIIFQKNVLITYCLNRGFRIIPAYFVIVGITAIILGQNFDWYLWNISFLKGWNHFWSVAEEIRYYLLLPIVISGMALLNNKYKQFIFIAIVTYVSYKFRSEHKIDMMDGRHVIFYFYMFMGGTLTYLAVNLPILKKHLRGEIPRKILTTLSFLILSSFMLSSSDLIRTFWGPLFPNLPENLALNGWSIPHIWLFLFMIFFFTLTFYQGGIVRKILECYFFRHIGLLSFSIYLSHMVILIKLLSLGLRDEWLFIVVLIASYLVSLVSYIFIEKPFLQLKKKISNRNN